jgi:anaerobic selenocysteine-containing dehydrogenase
MPRSDRFAAERRRTAKIPGAETGIQVKKTLCSICSNNCGINAYVQDGAVIKVEGSAENQFSRGTLCSKGAAMRQYVYHPDRIRTPLLKKGKGKTAEFEAISWDRAIEIAAERLNDIKNQYGPESVVFYVGFPKWMRSFVKRLAHRFGSPNFCTESSTCFFGTVVASQLTYGQMGGADLNGCNCLLVWSTNPFHSDTPAAKRLLRKRAEGMKVIEVGPFITPFTQHADIHLRLRPGTSGALALGMAHVIIEERLYDHGFINTYAHGFDEFREYVKAFPPKIVEDITTVPAEAMIKAARLYATAKPAAIMSGASPTVHHTNGVQNHRAITALIGLTGNFDRQGGNYVVPTSYFHAPNGLKTRDDEFEQVRPWEEMAPRMGHDVHPIWDKIKQEAQAMHLPFQIRSGEPYPIRGVVGFGMNYRMWPGSDFMKESLKQLDFLVTADLFMTDTTRLSDLVLPICSTFERQQLKMYPGRYGIWTEPIIDPIGQSRSDVEVIQDLSRSLGLDDALLEKGYRTCVDWILEPSGMQVADLEKNPGGCRLTVGAMPPYLKYRNGGFPTPTGKMEFTATILKEAGIESLPFYKEPKHSPRSTPDIAKDFPLVLTTGLQVADVFSFPDIPSALESKAETGPAGGDQPERCPGKGYIRKRPG